jgi:N-acetylglucosaminyldiphosphoundecaprenol N-acetyl-beta-D-mannosaminyltransferase
MIALNRQIKPISRGNVLGVGVSAINVALALENVEDWITRRNCHYICVTGVHGVMECQRDARLRQIHNEAGLVTPDGMPLVWLSRLQGFKHVDRVYGPDLMQAVCQQSLEKRWRHYFYGGGPGLAEKLIERLKLRFQGIDIAGSYAPPFRPMTPEEDKAAIDRINTSGADIVWIGLSTPKQEYWMADHLGKISAPVMLGVGAAFDFLSGSKLQAPRWIQRSGFEWLFRLVNEPKRLWRRYLRNYPQFVVLVLLQFLRLKRYPIN